MRLIQLGGTTRSFENYATDTYQIVLTEIPLDDVTISLTADSDLTVDPASLTFTPDNFNLAQIVTVSGRADGTIADRTLTIDHTVNSRDTNYEILPIDPVNVRLIDIDDIGNIQAQTRFFPRAFGDQSDQITASDEGSLLLGRDGNDVLLGANGPDQLYGNDGDDLLTGERNSDALFGGGGDDILIGGSEVDVLYGGESDDILYGDDGNDFLFGGRGNDELFGGSGNDALQGGFDSDVFVIGLNRGLDTFLDFQARLDRINLIDGLTFADLTIEQEATTNDSQIIETATGNILAILKTTPFNTIAASDFF
ncbi:MAG: hypothetical protein EAZ61_03745 [Oscillatoriales cyanobacterium]|nr:MAG: hypothetical protein EAZ61_03745 [Oscillatoriales cyanobacterium]